MCATQESIVKDAARKMAKATINAREVVRWRWRVVGGGWWVGNKHRSMLVHRSSFVGW
jgi:hypothetical protein